MTQLNNWLIEATRCLSKNSAAQVRGEIAQHYEAARERALSSGVTAEVADRLAVCDLGDAKAANRQYRKVLLTSAEARMLRQSKSEAQAICSRPWLKLLLPVIPVAVLLAAAALFLSGATPLAWILLTGGTTMSLLFAAPFLPMYTLHRGRLFRFVKWVVLAGMLGLAFEWSWLFIACLWPLAWAEWTRISIRRKLPVANWPKHLYL